MQVLRIGGSLFVGIRNLCCWKRFFALIDTAFIHRRAENNVGDFACTPGNYFDLGRHEFFGFTQEVPSCNLAVLGGGQVFRDVVNSTIYNLGRAKKRVVWGVGISPKDRASVGYDLVEGNCDLVSTRNWGIEGCEYVPCASAMSPLFDNAPEPTHDVVLFNHAKKSDKLVRVSGMPEQNNHSGTMADAVKFIASGATVVTNSFHGTYWAMCLGRKVLCVPFNRKFEFFRENPVMASPDDWPDQIKNAERREGVLQDARVLNQQFYEKVQNLI